jgi:hypothetical protein
LPFEEISKEEFILPSKVAKIEIKKQKPIVPETGFESDGVFIPVEES